jgi:death-on-curing protein
MAEPVWLSRAAALAFHEVSLARFGGLAGIRDEGLLDSALARPAMLLHYEPGTGVHRLAACYAVGLAKNHPFADGNKRTAFLSAYVFLRDNGWRLTASQAAVVVAMLGVASGTVGEAEFAAWLEANSESEER